MTDRPPASNSLPSGVYAAGRCLNCGNWIWSWTPIPYWMDGAADVAETTYTPFQSAPDAAPVRLIVRRVKPAPGSQLPLFATYSYHGFITDREGETLELEAVQHKCQYSCWGTRHRGVCGKQGKRIVSGATYPSSRSSGAWDAAFCRLRLRR